MQPTSGCYLLHVLYTIFFIRYFWEYQYWKTSRNREMDYCCLIVYLLLLRMYRMQTADTPHTGWTYKVLSVLFVYHFMCVFRGAYIFKQKRTVCCYIVACAKSLYCFIRFLINSLLRIIFINPLFTVICVKLTTDNRIRERAISLYS